MQNEEKKIYGVLILRNDLEHIVALETPDFQQAHNLWKELNEKWTNCIKDRTPFSIESPIVTSFDPGLIKELTVRPLIDNAQQRGGINNPYERNMRQNGLGNTLRNPVGTDILDGGYR